MKRGIVPALAASMVFAAHLAAPAVESGPAVGPPRPTAPPAARRGIPPVFEQASIPALAQKKIRPGPITVASLVEDSFAFKIDSVRYTSDNLTVSGLIAIPKSRKPPFPAVVICHGYYPPANYWQGLGTLDTIQALAAEGYLVFLPDYRGFPPSEGHATYPYPGEVMDVVQGVVSLSMHPKVDAKRIAVIGYSMGGGIALQAAEILGSQIKAFVDYYGQLGGFFLREDELALLLDQGVDFPMAEAIFKAKSPFHHLQRLSCPTLIFHGQNDRTVSISQSLMLRNELRRLAKPVDLVAFPEYGHAFGDSFRNRSFPQLLAFLKTQIGK